MVKGYFKQEVTSLLKTILEEHPFGHMKKGLKRNQKKQEGTYSFLIQCLLCNHILLHKEPGLWEVKQAEGARADQLWCFHICNFFPSTSACFFSLYEMKSKIYKAKSGDAPQVTRMTARKAAGIILGELYGGLWPWLLGAKPSPWGESHVNKAQFTCETRTFQDAEAQGQQHDGSSGPRQ